MDQRLVTGGRDVLFLRLIAVFEILLVVSTWSLWSGQTDFPAVPLWAALQLVPRHTDALIAVILLLSCGGLCAASADGAVTRWCCRIALTAGMLSALLNVHRLQPWHWLFVLVLLSNARRISSGRTGTWQILLASIYIFAGLSRLGPHAATGMSRQILITLASFATVDHALRDEHTLFVACTLADVFEVMTGLLLIVRRFRRPGIVCAVLLHAALLLALGPWGMKQQTGVLLWNFFLLVAVPLAFGRPRNASSSDSAAVGDIRSETAGQAAPVFFFRAALLAFFCSGFLGIADNWLAWQVYSPRPEVLQVYVREASVVRLPASVRAFAGTPGLLSEWRPVRIDRWSLDAVGAPIYPEDRFQLAVALAVCKDVPESDVRFRLTAPHPLAWWKRQPPRELARPEARAMCTQFWLNACVVR